MSLNDKPWISVESSNVDAIRYDAHNHQLQIRFKSGHAYEYDYVLPGTVGQLIGADSIGSRFHELIKKHPDLHPYRKIVEA